jgi:hypothetical protein
MRSLGERGRAVGGGVDLLGGVGARGPLVCWCMAAWGGRQVLEWRDTWGGREVDGRMACLRRDGV